MSILKPEFTGKLQKTQKNNNLLKTHYRFISFVGTHFLHLACQEGWFAPLLPVSYAIVYPVFDEILPQSKTIYKCSSFRGCSKMLKIDRSTTTE